MFTLDPVSNDKTKMVVDAVWGLGEMIVQGAVTPDHYVIDKATHTIVEKEVKCPREKYDEKGCKDTYLPLTKEKGGKQKISDKEILGLAQIGKNLEKHYFFPQDVEWAIEDEKLYIVQTRPVTTIGTKENRQKIAPSVVGTASAVKKELLIKGDAASPRVAAGTVRVIKSASEIGKILTGDVLVAQMTNPDFVPAMKRAVAIITDRGGRTSHAAIVSRELGIPAVVGAKIATTSLKDGMVVTVNGSTGEVFKGSVASSIHHHYNCSKIYDKTLKTATRVYVNLAEPDRAAAIAAQNVDGVGLFRAEFLMAQIGVHPKKFIEDKKEALFVNQMAAGMEEIAAAFNPRPVIYRASDFRTNEFRNLKGGDKYEPPEDNPMLGFRGAARYIADPRVFELELEAIKHVRQKKNLKNLHLMIPFVRSPRELLEVKKIVAANGLTRSASFKFSIWQHQQMSFSLMII